ncbi:hypothetical protein ACHAQJ_010397 [Trichoderma viride]
MTDIKQSRPEGIDTSSNATDRDSTVSQSEAKPAEIEPSSGVLEKNGATVEMEKTPQLDQIHLMATRPNGGWKAWLQVACGFSLIGAAGPLYDAGYTRFLVIAGAILIVFGTMMQSLCTQYWQFILAESLCIGLGGGLTSFLSPAVLSTYFTSLYPLTQGIAASGAGIGG